MERKPPASRTSACAASLPVPSWRKRSAVSCNRGTWCSSRARAPRAWKKWRTPCARPCARPWARTPSGERASVFLEFLYPLHEHPGLGFLNVFRYITFRSAYAAVFALFLALVLGKPVIAWLRRFRIGQKIREEGPQGHQVKAGTPTMGGVLIILCIFVPTLLFGNLKSHDVLLALLATLWLRALGFLCAYPPVVRGLP